LRIYSPESHSQEWGILQNDLATVYHFRVKGSRADNLEEAIAHYQLALTVRTRGHEPHRWAMTLSNLASAYCVRIRGDRADNIERAVELLARVLEVRTREAYPVEYAQTHNNLANASRCVCSEIERRTWIWRLHTTAGL
jgi:hypothetical protein